MSAHGISIYSAYTVPSTYPRRTLAWHRDTLLSIIGPWLLHQPWPTQGQHTFIKTQIYVCFRYYSKRYLEKYLLSFFHTFAQFANVCCSNFTKYQAKVDHLQSQARRTAARENGFYSFAPSLTQHEEFYNIQRSSNNWRPLYGANEPTFQFKVSNGNFILNVRRDQCRGEHFVAYFFIIIDEFCSFLRSYQNIGLTILLNFMKHT